MGGVKHTAGPWVVEDGWLQREDGAYVDGRYFSICVTATSIADISLIAAAPDLLEALELALEYIQSCPDQLSASGQVARESARSAISKATGETK